MMPVSTRSTAATANLARTNQTFSSAISVSFTRELDLPSFRLVEAEPAHEATKPRYKALNGSIVLRTYLVAYLAT